MVVSDQVKNFYGEVEQLQTKIYVKHAQINSFVKSF